MAVAEAEAVEVLALVLVLVLVQRKLVVYLALEVVVSQGQEINYLDNAGKLSEYCNYINLVVFGVINFELL